MNYVNGQGHRKKRGLKPRHIFGIVTILVFFFFLYEAIFSRQGSVFLAEKDRITVSLVDTGLFIDYITVIGQVEPILTIFLDAEEAGKVEEKLIEEGEMVKKGDVILKLRNNDLNLSIMNSESSLAFHSNELRNTMIQMEQQRIQNLQQLLRIDYEILRLERNYEQKKSFYQGGLIAREDFLSIEEDYFFTKKNRDLIYKKLVTDSIFRNNQKERMEQDMENMHLNLLMARQRREDLNIKAPVDGQLGLLEAEIGESIGKGQRIGMIHVLTDYKVKARIDEHYIDLVQGDLEATFERNEITYMLSVKKVYPEVRDGQFEIDLIFKGGKPDNIRTGQNYYVKLELGQSKKTLLLPRGGFFQKTGGQWIYVLNENGTEALKRSIRIGKQNPQYYEVLEGLREGEKVITSGYEVFGDNDKIVIK